MQGFRLVSVPSSPQTQPVTCNTCATSGHTLNLQTFEKRSLLLSHCQKYRTHPHDLCHQRPGGVARLRAGVHADVGVAPARHRRRRQLLLTRRVKARVQQHLNGIAHDFVDEGGRAAVATSAALGALILVLLDDALNEVGESLQTAGGK